MILRSATPDDIQSLARLGEESFCAAFAHLYRVEDLDAFLAEVYSPANVAHEVASQDFEHCLAEADGKLLGYCKLSLDSSFAKHSDAANPIALSQLYAAAGETGRGIGAALMEWAIDYAKEQAAGALQLSVYAENFGAHRFYERYGFAKIADITFNVGSHVDPEFLYELRLDGRE